MAYAGVALDIYAGLHPAGGIGRYVRDLCAALRTLPGAPPARFAYPRNLRGKARERFRPEELHELPFNWLIMRGWIMSSAWWGVALDGAYGNPAVVHSPVGYGPRFPHAKLILNVHDLTCFDHPEWHPRRTVAFMRATMPAAARSAARVICHSEHVRRRVMERLRVDASHAVTLPPPLGHDFRPVPHAEARAHAARRFGLQGEFILHVGTVEPRKNHVGLVGCFERMRRAGFPGPLVLVGGKGWRGRPILSRIERSPERSMIRRLMDLDERDLAALYGACTLCALPSLEEGFGMPLLESMACGTACVASDDPALRELGEGCALFASPTDHDAWTEAMTSLWRDPERRKAMAGAGPERAEGYVFERWAERVFALYRSVLAEAGVS